jgi:hypothetical protein
MAAWRGLQRDGLRAMPGVDAPGVPVDGWILSNADHVQGSNQTMALDRPNNMQKVYYLVFLGLSRIVPFQLLLKARNIVSKLTGNPDFATPTPPLPTVSDAADVLDAALKAHADNPGPREKEARDNAFDVLKGLVVDLGGYIQAASNGRKELIEGAGCEVRRDSSPIGQLPAPLGLLALTTSYAGRLDIRWSGVPGRILYALEICAGDPKVASDWSLLVQTSRNRFSAMGLQSDHTYFFRVAALGTAGMSPVSDTASAKAA